MGDNLEIIGTGVAGGGLALVLARAFVTKILKQFEGVVEKLDSLLVTVAVIRSQMEALEEVKELVYEHDREIAAIKAGFLNGKGERSNYRDSKI